MPTQCREACGSGAARGSRLQYLGLPSTRRRVLPHLPSSRGRLPQALRHQGKNPDADAQECNALARQDGRRRWQRGVPEAPEDSKAEQDEEETTAPHPHMHPCGRFDVHGWARSTEVATGWATEKKPPIPAAL
jgi:hypothetical protein